MGRLRKNAKKIITRKSDRIANANSNQINVGDFVFGKVRGFRAWPARVLRKEGKMYRVFFYGSNNISKVAEAQIFDYETHKERLSKKPFNLFKTSMQNAEYMFANPSKDDCYFQAKCEMEANESAEQPDEDLPPKPNKPDKPAPPVLPQTPNSPPSQLLASPISNDMSTDSETEWQEKGPKDHITGDSD